MVFFFSYPCSTLQTRSDSSNPHYTYNYINSSQMHECRNWERGRVYYDTIVSFLEIFISKFRHSVFAVHGVVRTLCMCVHFCTYIPLPPPLPVEMYKLMWVFTSGCCSRSKSQGTSPPPPPPPPRHTGPETYSVRGQIIWLHEPQIKI